MPNKKYGNGIWRWTGSAWEWSMPLPYSFINATNAGAGTPNAIQATSDIPVSEAALIILPIAQTNTASPVRVSFNGGALLTIKSNSGNDIVVGGLAAGMHVTGVIVDNIFQLVSDQVSASIAAAAEASAQASQASANNAATQVTNAKAWSDQAKAYAATANPSNFVPIRPNLCPNGGLEDGLSGIRFWNDVDGFYNGGSIRDSAYWGRNCNLTLKTGATLYQVIWPTFTAVAGQRLTVSGDAVIFATSGTAFYQIVWLDASGTESYGNIALQSAARDFTDTAAGRQAFATSSVAPAGTVSAYVRCVFQNLNTPTVLQVRLAKAEFGDLPASFYSPFVKPIDAQVDRIVEKYGISTSNTAALNDAGWTRLKAAVEASAFGSRIKFDAGVYNFTKIVMPSRNTVTIEGIGPGENGTTLQFGGSGELIYINAVQHCSVRNLQIKQSVRNSANAITIDGNAFKTIIDNVRVDYACNGVWIKKATETVVREVYYRYMFGDFGTKFGGGSSGCYRAVLSNVENDNPYRAEPKNRGNRAASTAYAVNDIVVVNGLIWQCITAGTTATGSGPAAMPGTSTVEAFTGAVTDGTVTWAFISTVSYTGCVQDSYGYSLVLDNVVCLNGAQGFAMRDTVNNGSSRPMWCLAKELELDHNYAAAINLERGEGFFGGLIWAGSCLNGNGIQVLSTFKGEVYLIPSTRVHGNAQHGVLVQAGPIVVSLNGVQASANSQAAVNTYHGIAIASGASEFIIVSCMAGGNVYGASSQNAGIYIGNNCSRFIVALNICSFNLTTGLIQGTGHTNGNFQFNI